MSVKGLQTKTYTKIHF